MYKLLLSWRYLRTRYIALASIISVTLGVGTLIVVNSVMAGFAREMHDRLHNILADVIIEGHSLDGFQDPQWHMEEVRKVCGDDVQKMTAAVHVPHILDNLGEPNRLSAAMSGARVGLAAPPEDEAYAASD